MWKYCGEWRSDEKCDEECDEERDEEFGEEFGEISVTQFVEVVMRCSVMRCLVMKNCFITVS